MIRRYFSLLEGSFLLKTIRYDIEADRYNALISIELLELHYLVALMTIIFPLTVSSNDILPEGFYGSFMLQHSENYDEFAKHNGNAGKAFPFNLIALIQASHGSIKELRE